MTVRENIVLGPESQGLPKAETMKRVDELFKMVGILEVANSYPVKLSGGQQKRVALAPHTRREAEDTTNGRATYLPQP